MQCTLTLANEGLAGVQQNITALNNHSFNGKIFPYVFSVAHLVMHYSVEERQTERYFFYCLWEQPSKEDLFRVVLDSICVTFSVGARDHANGT